MKNKKEKVVLTAEEKAERKLEKKYRIFRNKVLAIISSILLVACVVGSTILESSGARLQSASDLIAILGAVTTIGMCIFPFLIFRKFTLSLLALGSSMLITGIISNGQEPLSIGISVMGFTLILMFIVMKIYNKKLRNYNIKLDINLLAVLVEDSENGKIEQTLDYGCYAETLYKAKYYLTAAIISALACGVGLLLPFGAWACSYFKSLGVLFGDIKEKENSPNYNEDKPFKNLLNRNEFYFYGKTFSSQSPFYSYANAGMFLSIGYEFLTCFSALIKKPTYFDEDDTYAGSVAFSTKEVNALNPEIAQAFVSYSKKQTDENRQYFIDALQQLSDSYDEWSEREGRRLDAYEEEKWRSARKYATGADIKTDGKDYYVEGTYGGLAGSKKLEGYDQTTGVGYYTDESGKKIEVKNVNIKK